MNGRAQNAEMPGVPDMRFMDAIYEMWFVVSYAAYHLAYVRVYLQAEALQTDVDVMARQEQAVRDAAQVDLVICRTHLAAFFWQLDHFFEALRTAIKRGQREYPDLKYFRECKKTLAGIEQDPIRKEIKAYRNKAHSTPAIIGCKWAAGKGAKFLHHFLPTIRGHAKKESVDINTDLQQYFDFVVNVWLAFVPGELKSKFPRNFSFPVTTPHTFIGELQLTGVPQMQMSIEICEPAVEPKAADDSKPMGLGNEPCRN